MTLHNHGLLPMPCSNQRPCWSIISIYYMVEGRALYHLMNLLLLLTATTRHVLAAVVPQLTEQIAAHAKGITLRRR